MLKNSAKSSIGIAVKLDKKKHTALNFHQKDLGSL
jgi:hypothetical protein